MTIAGNLYTQLFVSQVKLNNYQFFIPKTIPDDENTLCLSHRSWGLGASKLMNCPKQQHVTPYIAASVSLRDRRSHHNAVIIFSTARQQCSQHNYNKLISLKLQPFCRSSQIHPSCDMFLLYQALQYSCFLGTSRLVPS